MEKPLSGIHRIPATKLSSVQSLSHVQLFVTRWTAAWQVSLSIANSRSLLKLALVHKASDAIQPSRRPLLLPPSIGPSSRVFSYELILCIRWPKYCSFSFNISPSMNIQTGLIWDGPDGSPCSQSKGLSRVFSNTTVQKHHFFGAQLSL